MRAKRAGKNWNWTVASKHVIIECERSEPQNFCKLNFCERSERKILGKFCTFPPNSSKLRSDYLFSFQKRTNYLFPAFSRSEYLFPKSASPPPLRIKWWSPKKQGVGMHVLNDWKSAFLRIADIRIDNFTTHPHLYKQPPSRSVKAPKRKNGKYLCTCWQSSK